MIVYRPVDPNDDEQDSSIAYEDLDSAKASLGMEYTWEIWTNLTGKHVGYETNEGWSGPYIEIITIA